MGRRRRDRFHGVLVVDKPGGMTSHDVVDVVRKAAGQRGVGHTGTLDPDATGVLVLCLGKATRLARFLQAGTKTYATTVRFGAVTTSQDASGEVVEEHGADHLTEADVAAALVAFEGDIEQVPPMVSAVKVDGERLHEKARRGEEVEREARPVTIHALTLDAFRGGSAPEADLTVTCSAGTYVRTLGHDLGRTLGTGAHLVSLRRTVNGGFGTDAAHDLDAIAAAGERRALGDLVVPIDRALAALPNVAVDAEGARDLAFGRDREAAGYAGPYTLTYGGRLLAVFADRDGRGRAEVVLVQPEDLAPDGEDAR